MECGIREDVELIPESNQLLTSELKISPSVVAAQALALALALAQARCTALVASLSATGLTSG
jgi:hypothetical protein